MFESITAGGLTAANVAECTAVAIALGVVVAATYMIKGNYTKSFILSLVLLPAIVQVVIMMVNGNLGVGIAVFGAFSLVRFRSAQGSAKDITSVFLSMAIGLATGMGQIAFAALFTVVICAVFVALKFIPLTEFSRNGHDKTVKVVCPESCNFDRDFNGVFKKYCSRVTLEKTKTTNMGSLYELKYHIVLKSGCSERDFIEELRTLNSNLPITCARYVESGDEL